MAACSQDSEAELFKVNFQNVVLCFSCFIVDCPLLPAQFGSALQKDQTLTDAPEGKAMH